MRQEIKTSAKIYVGSGAHKVSHRLPLDIDKDTFHDAVRSVIADRFIGATIQKATGYFDGRFEPSLVVEVWDTSSNNRTAFLREVVLAAHDLVENLDQISVAVVAPKAKGGGQTVTYVEPDTVKKRKARKGRFVNVQAA